MERPKILIVILLVALLLRLGVSIQAKGGPVSDGLEYEGYALSLLSGQGYQYETGGEVHRSDRLPLYPIFLAGTYFLFNHSHLAVRILQALLSVLTVFLIIRLGERLSFGRAALLGGGLAAIYPNFLIYFGPGFILTETAFLFMVVLAVERASAALERPSAARLIGLGLALVASALVKGTGVLFPFFILAYLALWSGWTVGEKARRVGGVLLVFVVILSPWMIRNYRIHDSWVFSTKGGQVFWESNNPTARGGWAPVNPQDQDLERNLTERKRQYLAQRASLRAEKADEVQAIMSRYPTSGLSEVKGNQVQLRMGLDYWIGYPARVPKLLFRKFLLLWNPIGLDFFLGYTLLLPFGLLGLWVAWRRGRGGLLLTPILYFNFTTLLFYGHPRFRLPFEPFLVLASALGLTQTWRLCRARPVTFVLPAVWVVLCLLAAWDVDRALALLRGLFSLLGLR